MNHRRLTIALATILTLSTLIPMIYAPSRQEWGDPIGVLIDIRDDPSLIGAATSMTVALDRVDIIEEDLGIDIPEKSITDLTPRELAKLTKAVDHAQDKINKFKADAGLLNKSLDSEELDALDYLNGLLPSLN